MITLSADGLTTPMKRQELLNRIKYHNPVTSCQQEELFKNANGFNSKRMVKRCTMQILSQRKLDMLY